MRRSVSWAIGLGLAPSLVNSLVNAVGGPYAPHPLSPDGVWFLQLTGAVLGTRWCRAAYGFLLGTPADGWWRGALCGAGGLLVAEVACDSADFFSGVDSGFSTAEMVSWTGCAAVAGPATDALGALTRRRCRRSILPGLVTVVALRLLREESGADIVRPAALTTQTVVSVVLLLGLDGRRLLAHGRRPRAQPSARAAR